MRSFDSEWRRQKDERPLKSIAIVDDDPEHQYLYPEFDLFERMFKRHGLEAVIASTAEASSTATVGSCLAISRSTSSTID